MIFSDFFYFFLKLSEGGPKVRPSKASLNIFCHVGYFLVNFWTKFSDKTLVTNRTQVGQVASDKLHAVVLVAGDTRSHWSQLVVVRVARFTSDKKDAVWASLIVSEMNKTRMRA